MGVCAAVANTGKNKISDTIDVKLSYTQQLFDLTGGELDWRCLVWDIRTNVRRSEFVFHRAEFIYFIYIFYLMRTEHRNEHLVQTHDDM